MKKLICLLALTILVSGCAATMSQITAPNRSNLLKLSIGMIKSEVINIMGTETMTASYIPPGGGLMHTRTTKITNPYRSEILQGEDKTLEVIYYVTDVKKDDHAITDDELTPLVFDKGKLIGWGNGFLQKNINKYEFRIR